MTKEVQYYINLTAHEEDGIWDLVNSLSQALNISRHKAFQKVKDEIEYTEANNIQLVKSKKLYDFDNCEILDNKKLLDFNLEDVEFKEQGPFYYLLKNIESDY